jgi:hypothetical protein
MPNLSKKNGTIVWAQPCRKPINARCSRNHLVTLSSNNQMSVDEEYPSGYFHHLRDIYLKTKTSRFVAGYDSEGKENFLN